VKPQQSDRSRLHHCDTTSSTKFQDQHCEIATVKQRNLLVGVLVIVLVDYCASIGTTFPRKHKSAVFQLVAEGARG
jgi:hypothetical protein